MMRTNAISAFLMKVAACLLLAAGASFSMSAANETAFAEAQQSKVTVKGVVKDTLIVLVICLLIGILIWVCDKGLGELIKWIMSGKA